MRSPEYTELRGIPGTAVGAKAQLYTDPRKRSLLFFLQALSLKHGGLPKVAHDLIAAFPERAGGSNHEEEVAHLLVEFCINPQCIVRFSDDKAPVSSSPPLADVLRDFKDPYEDSVHSAFFLPPISQTLFDNL